jgi:hypothetical protein
MTAVLSPIEFDHLVQVVRHRACGYRAECWCGWASAWCDEYATADEAADLHHEVEARPASGLDAALSGLLALQDDLADAVMWLAENWSSDLPQIAACPRSAHLENGECVPCVGLIVRCSTASEVLCLAELLEAPMVAYAEPNSPRSQWATRSFGRVQIEVFSESPATPE